MSRSAPLDQDVSGIIRTTTTGAPTSEPSERVTVSSVPISRESVVSVNSTVDVEAAWLDRLVVAACEMPVPHELEVSLLAGTEPAGETVVAWALLPASQKNLSSKRHPL